MSSSGIISKALIYGGGILTNNHLPVLPVLRMPVKPHIILTEYTVDVTDINSSNPVNNESALTTDVWREIVSQLVKCLVEVFILYLASNPE